MDAVKAMHASLRVPKKIVEGDGSKIQEQDRKFQEFKFESSTCAMSGSIVTPSAKNTSVQKN